MCRSLVFLIVLLVLCVPLTKPKLRSHGSFTFSAILNEIVFRDETNRSRGSLFCAPVIRRTFVVEQMYLNVSLITYTLSYARKIQKKRQRIHTSRVVENEDDMRREKSSFNAKPNEVVSRYPYLIFAYYHCKLAFLFCLNRIFAVSTLNARRRVLLLLSLMPL